MVAFFVIVGNYLLEYTQEISIPVTWEQYKATKLKSYKSLKGFLKNSNGRRGNADFFLNDGTFVSGANSREVNERLRSTLKKYNNPIDLLRAIASP